MLLGFRRAGTSPHEELYLQCAVHRLESLGWHLTIGDPITWDRAFDYSGYSVVALLASCGPIKDPEYLLSLLVSGAIGFVVFGAWNSAATLHCLGLLAEDKIKHQSAYQVTPSRPPCPSPFPDGPGEQREPATTRTHNRSEPAL